jgi:MFS family permease
LAFTLRKFIENPALIGFLGSLNVAFNFMVGVLTSYMSDRIWTRWGRRRPFLIVGWIGVALSLIFVPLAPNPWVLMGIIIFFQFCADIAKPLEPLMNEVVPAAQRGRAATIRNVAQNLIVMFFFSVMLAQFDQMYDLEAFGRTFQINGEMTLYWTGSFLLLLGVAVLAFRVRETPPPETIRRERFNPRIFLRDIFGQRQWWTVYLLYAVPLVTAPGLSVFEPLMRTEQFGFSKADFAWAVSIGLVVNICLYVPLAGYLADRISRLRLLQVSIVAHTTVTAVFYFYLRYVSNYSISLPTLVAFGLTASAFGACINVVWGPLVYDYIPSDRFGTVSAGLTVVSGIVPFYLINIAGLWVTGFTEIFGPRGAGRYDYSSIYLLQFIGAASALALTRYVAREEKAGRLIPYGRLELMKSR